ncbi:uncharacterized protein LOC126889827 isoform X1 [Diabrotica virgifera virgifera]|uniref:Phosphodiesterase n=2 Tax=Diabrotica virgifera virgifera TaxID=50390 RepID=A0ABM5KWA1_DIAVI|nr:uncharacterized protein LOC126889827 isoform X1 [Diabrotica virgifera virgifera]
MRALSETPTMQHVFSKEDWALLDAMTTVPVPVCHGKFLTMHKRRRKKLTTRSLSQDHAILDDIHHGQVQKILDRCTKWAFNAFTLETVAGGKSLPVLCVHLFHWYGLLDYFHLEVVRVWKLFTLIEEGYHSTNPYHNSIHATDVTQAMHCFLQETRIRRHITPLEIMASLIGAVAHDLDHPGVNQHFLISTSNHLAILYQNKSVLENHHWRSAVGCLLESGVAEQLTPYRSELEQQIRDLILATDINRQNEFLTQFKKHLDEDTLDLREAHHRQFIMQIALKCADISNPTRPWDISKKWSSKVCDEFFRQGEFERKLNLPVTSICDQQSTSVAKIQVGFFKNVVTPLFAEWHRFMSSNLSTHMMNILDTNRKRWEAQEKAEQAEETQTELSDAEPEIASDDEEELLTTKSSTSRCTQEYASHAPRDIGRQSLTVPTLESLEVRRHSVPVNMEHTLPRPIYRRESLPTGKGILLNRTPVSPQTESRASSGLKEEDELLPPYGSQSDMSSSPPYSSEQPERPLSAENLLPEPTIASMTSSTAVSRLTSILQGNVVVPNKLLTRQQTFPPPQPYIRMRYMSATAEMSTCAEIPSEGGSGSSSSHSSPENISNLSNIPQNIPTIAVLSPNNSRSPDFLDLSPPDSSKNKSSCSYKKDTDVIDKEKNGKMVVISEVGQKREKENLDPKRLGSAHLNKRRGSAPVMPTLPKPDEKISPASRGLVVSDTDSLRRGSVPIEVAQYHIIEKKNLHQLQFPRRGSAPTNIISIFGGNGEKLEQLTRHTSLNGKAGRRKKLKRRISGGPETFCQADTFSEATSRLFLLRKPEDTEALLVQRRGSLPVEVLSFGHSVF